MQIASDRSDLPDSAEVRRWVEAVFTHLGHGGERAAELSVRVVDEDEGRQLNSDYRGKDSATNVLSFPAGEDFVVPDSAPRPLGDLVLCAPVVAREAVAQGKEPASHWAHLLVHGTLHLLGYDHQQDAAATEMEALEIAILADHGLPNPYIGKECR